MKRFEIAPDISDANIEEKREIFRHSMFIDASAEKQNEIMLRSSESKYQSEKHYPWDHYFDIGLRQFLEGRTVLDIGCFTGGRSIAWAESYGIGYLFGIDVSPLYIRAAKRFASIKGIESDFKPGMGEKLPFEDNTMDAILSFDVLEHVQDLQQTLDECFRVLKPSGKMILVFPSYYHPVEHHLKLVTSAPCIHYFFSGEVLIQAYYEIIESRGCNATWYNRDKPELDSWEKGNHINGTTCRILRKILHRNPWRIISQGRKPIGSVGRNASRRSYLQAISYLLYPLIYIPGLQDFFLHRISYVLEKQERK